MTQRQKNFNWSIVATVLLLAGIVWRGSAIASTVCDNTEDIAEVNSKATQALIMATETRTLAGEWKERFEDIEERLDNLEHMEDMIEDIHDAIVGGE